MEGACFLLPSAVVDTMPPLLFHKMVHDGLDQFNLLFMMFSIKCPRRERDEKGTSARVRA